MDPKKREIKKFLVEELFLMKNPMDRNDRIESWKQLLIQLVLLKKIERFNINYSGTEINFDINNFTYYISFENDHNIQMLIREKVIDQLIGL